MKKLLVVLMVCLVCSVGVLANELKNGGFESTVGEGNWNMQWGSASVENWNNPPEGTHACYLKGKWADDGDSAGIIQSLPAEPFVTYQLSAYFYTDNGWTSESRALKIEFFDKDDNVLLAKTDNLEDLADGTWIKKDLLAQAPEATERMQVVVEAFGMGGSGVLGVDNVLLAR